MTPIELAVLAKEHFEDNLDKLVNSETIADYKKLISLQTTPQIVNRRKPNLEGPLTGNVID